MFNLSLLPSPLLKSLTQGCWQGKHIKYAHKKVRWLHSPSDITEILLFLEGLGVAGHDLLCAHLKKVWGKRTTAFSIEPSLLVIPKYCSFCSTSDNSPNDSFISNHNWKIQETKLWLKYLYEKKSLLILRWLISTCKKKKKKMTFSLLQSLMIKKLVSYRNQIFGMIRATLDYKKPAASLHRWENKEERNEVAPVWGKYD